MAKTQLSITLGMSSDSNFELQEPDQVANQSNSPGELEKQALAQRPDLKRVRLEESAQGKSVAMARAAFGPRVNAFGSWQTDSQTLGWTGGNNWTAGVELQFDLFAGGSKLAQLNREQATQERAAALRQAFEDNIRLEVRRAYYDADAARQQVDVAQSAIKQAEESLRIQQNRYDSGLSTVTDLLRAEEAAHRARTDYWNAKYRTATSYAALDLATGTLTPSSPVVKP
jgi:outer membrane protein TolC